MSTSINLSSNDHQSEADRATQNLSPVVSYLGDQFLTARGGTTNSPQQITPLQHRSPGGNSVTVPNITFVHGKDAKMLTSKKKMSHETIQEVFNSYRTLKFQDNAISHVRLMDATVHALLDMEFRNQSDWRTMDSTNFFEFLLRQYPAAKKSAKSTIEDYFRHLDRKLFHVDINDPVLQRPFLRGTSRSGSTR
jgi:hypothetical protein